MGTAVWDESININPKNTDIKYLNGKGSGASITYNTTWKESGGGTGETVPVSDPITFNSVWANQITSTTAHVQADVTWDGSALTEVGMKWGFSTAMNNDPLTDDVGSVLTKIYYDFGSNGYPSLLPGTTYYYQFYATDGNKVYNTNSSGSFTTAGTAQSSKFSFAANGGSGTMNPVTVSVGGSKALPANAFTRSGYQFAGWNVQRSDGKWYTNGSGWQTDSQISSGGYTKKLYPDCYSLTYDQSWYRDLKNNFLNYTFYAVWEVAPDVTYTANWYANYSGKNYFYDSAFTQPLNEEHYFSRDTSVVTVSVDPETRFIHYPSLRFDVLAEGSSGHDVSLYTMTQGNQADNSFVGDDRYLTLSFMARSSVDGVTMYYRWGYQSVNEYTAIELSSDWGLYSMGIEKRPEYGNFLHIYFDTPGSTVWLSELQLEDVRPDSSDNTDFLNEVGPASTISYIGGKPFGELPELTRKGYIFDGWFTQAQGGTQITEVILNDGLLSIGENAFSSCHGLTSIYLPETLTTIEDSAFSGTGLTSVILPASLTSLGSQAFFWSELADIQVEVGNMFYSSADGVLYSADGTELILYPPYKADAEFTVPEGVTTIGNASMMESYHLNSIIFPRTLTTIGTNNFTWSEGLSQFRFTGNAPDIDEYGFSGITVTAYYPENNPTWTEDVLQNYDGNITWVPYTAINLVDSGTCGTDVRWELTDDGVLTVSGTGSMANYTTNAKVPWAGYASQITRLVIGDGITFIGNRTFAGLSNLTDVTIPNSVTSIGEAAFSTCSALEHIDLPENLTSIGRYAFNYCTKLISITLPEGLTSISEGTFYACRKLESVTIPDSVTTMGNYAFYQCDSMTHVSIGSGLTTMGKNAFEVCDSLTSVIIHNAPVSIGNYAFTWCEALETVDLGSKVTAIGIGAFHYCSSLTGIVIPDTVTVIPDNAFYNCSALRTVDIGNGVTEIGKEAFNLCKSLTELTVPDSVVTIGDTAFGSCSAMTSLTLGDGVTSIGTRAFASCSKLASVDIGRSLSTIGTQAFSACPVLTTITLDEENEALCLSDGVLYSEDMTRLLLVPASVTGHFDIPDTVTVIGDSAFTNRGNITSVTIPGGVTEIGDYAFYCCTGLTDLVLPDTVTAVGKYAFGGSTALKTIIIPDSVTSIGERTFNSCTALEQVTLGNGITTLPDYAFSNCSALTAVVLPEGLTALGSYAFSGCKNLASITFPASLSAIGDWAFKACYGLKEITFTGDAPVYGGSSVFNGVTAMVYYPMGNPTWTEEALSADVSGTLTWVPYDTVSEVASGWSGNTTWVLTSDGVLTFSGKGRMKNYTYKSEMPWYTYMDQIESVVIGDGITSIGDYAFYGFGITSIQIPESVTTIGSFAFKNAAQLDNVVLPSGLTKLGESAFYACTSLSSIEIPAALWTIQPYTFKNCTGLTELILNEGNLQKIADGAFYNTALTAVELPDCLSILDSYVFKNCSQLAEVKLSASLTQIREASLYGTAISHIEIPEGVTSIKPYAFKNCVNLVSVELPESLTAVDEAAFYACTGLASLDLPDAVTTIGNYAFRKCTGLTSVKFGSGLKTIGESSFYGCTGITGLNFPRGLTTIKSYAFKGCSALTGVAFPTTLTTLGDSAFHSCTALGEIIIPSRVTAIGEYCFSGSTGIKTIEFLGNAPAIGSGAFNKIIATAFYPDGDSTWTSDVMQSYGGTITWEAY